MLSPMRLKNGCSVTFTTTYKSPGGPPNGPASPFPGMRIRDPVLTPAGNSTSTVSVAATRPSPPHSLQELINRPDPPHSAQVTVNCRWPFDRVVLPVPLQVPHAVSREPGVCPVPPQMPQASFRKTLITAWRPRSDSSKLMDT